MSVRKCIHKKTEKERDRERRQSPTGKKGAEKEKERLQNEKFGTGRWIGRKCNVIY